MVETWRSVAGYAGFYEVSDYGRVRSLPRCVGGRWGNEFRSGQLIKMRPNHEGYLLVGLRKGGVKKHFAVHILVLRAFVGPPPVGLEARHKNGNSGDARLTNLVYGCHAENMADKTLHGTAIWGEHHPLAKLTEVAVREIRLKSCLFSGRELAQQYGVSKHAINAMLRGDTWGRM